MKHGGNILDYGQNYSGRLIDYSSNINPMGPPEGLGEFLMGSYGEITAYPDINYRHLRRNVSDYLGCKPEEVILGNGAVEIIDNIISLFKRVIVATPCFSEYIMRAELRNREVVRVKLNDDFMLTQDCLKLTMNRGDLIILGNPNNPTGRRIDRESLINIHTQVQRAGAYLLLDEAFYEFCPEDYDSIKLFYNSNNVCIIRAATKFFALPGIRLGYAFCKGEFREKYNSIVLPWNINMFADMAGRYIFKDLAYIKKTKEYVNFQREYLLRELKKMSSLEVYNTHSNFILIKLLLGKEEDIFNFMLARGILIRKASSFEGLDSSYIRIAIKSEEDNNYLLECFKEFDEHYVDKEKINT